ncbi:MAG: hypothetical protein J6V25_01675 [Oscillospiraceae bacterium]|nr:hypothetical protein [Oscillospiraceae bacterium]
MKRNKLYSAVLSVLLAFGLWLYVVNNVSSEAEDTFYNIPVVLEGEAILTERNLVITNQSVQTVSLKLSGTRSDLNKVNSGNITIKADLSTVDGPGDKIALTYTISYPGDVASNAFVVESRSPSYIYIDVDSRRTKEIPVNVQWTGTRSGDYIYDTENAVLDYPVITVIGPAAVADQIQQAVIEVDLSDRTESMSESFRYTLCDGEGNPVDAAQITTNIDAVRLDMKIQRIKEVKLVVDVVYGGGTSDLNTSVQVEPGVLRLSGSEAALAEIGDTYTVCTVNLAEIEKSQDLKYTIAIPEGVTNITGVTEATVSIRFSGLSTREFEVDNIQMVNVPEGMKAEILNSSLKIKVRGPASEISLLTEHDIVIVVDFSTAEIGNSTFKATVTFTEDFPNVGAMKTYSVSATVTSLDGGD